MRGLRYDRNFKFIKIEFEHCGESIDDKDCASREEREEFWKSTYPFVQANFKHVDLSNQEHPLQHSVSFISFDKNL